MVRVGNRRHTPEAVKDTIVTISRHKTCEEMVEEKR